MARAALLRGLACSSLGDRTHLAQGGCGHEFGLIVASRSVEAVEPDGRVLEIGTPRPAPDQDWICPCRIKGLDDSRVRIMYGIDSMQSLAIATDLLAGQLAVSAEERGWTFNWLGSRDLPVEAVPHMRPSVWDGRKDWGEREDEADREDPDG